MSKLTGFTRLLMDKDGIRAVFVGEEWNILWTGLVLGVLTVVPLRVLLYLLDSLLYIAPFYLLVYVIVIGTLTTVVRWVGGGLLPVGIAVFPVVSVASSRHWSPGLGASSPGTLLVQAFGGALVVGALAYAVVEAIARVRLQMEHVDPTGTSTETMGAETVSDHEAGAVASLNRRTVLFTVGGIMTIVVGVFGHLNGWWCKRSPADLGVYNESGTNVDLRISVFQQGDEVFHAEPELGVGEVRNSNVGHPKDIEYEGAIPIGCSLPEDLTVEIASDSHVSTTRTVTFPPVDPPSGGGVYSESYLRIELFKDDIKIEADHVYTVH